MWNSYYTVASIDDALEILDAEREKARIIAGGTDLVLELKKGLYPKVKTIVDINRVDKLNRIWEDDRYIYLDPLVTHNQVMISQLLLTHAMPLVKASHSIGAAQIRNIGTVYGNVITASPANDTIPPLVTLEAELLLQSKSGERWVSITAFYEGVRKTVLNSNEMVTSMRILKMKPESRGVFVKYMLRNAHGISVANAAVILNFDGIVITNAKIALGAVSPKIIRSERAETYLTNKEITSDTILEAGKLCEESASPISDIRSSEGYRGHLIPILVEKAMKQIQSGEWKHFPEKPVLLQGKEPIMKNPLLKTLKHTKEISIETTINKNSYTFTSGQNNTLLNLVREEAGLTGTKLGCGEGECGACTLHMNGLPVFSCLVPAPRAHEADIVTIEGISEGDKLHPVQQAFIDEGAIQCGYCTPGFVMSAFKLLEEKPHPTNMEIREGLAGNICRCTGYYSIIRAVEKAVQENSGF